MSAPAAIAPSPASARWALAALSLAMLLSSLGTSIANVALPTLARAFGASFPEVQWVVLAYLLAVTTLIVGAGRLGDLFGRRRLLLVGLATFTLASVACAAAPGLPMLLVARAGQGLGAAILMALTMAFVGGLVPPDRTGSAMGLLGTMSAVGTALGPSLGGVLIAGFGWPAIFLLNVPLGLLAFGLALRHLPADRPRAATRPRLDVPGTLLLALTLAAYALAVTLGRGSFGVWNVVLLIGSVVGLGLFLVVETRVPAPLVSLAMFRDAFLRAGLVTSGLVATVMMATLVVGPFYLSRTLGLAPALVGAVMAAGPLVAALTGVPAGRLVDRVGARRATLAGLAALATGCALLALLPSAWGIAGYGLPSVLATAGYALFQAANTTAIMSGVAPETRGVVSGLVNLSRNLGLVTGAAVLGALFALASGTPDIASAPPEAVATGMHTSFAVAAVFIGVAIVLAAGARRTPSMP